MSEAKRFQTYITNPVTCGMLKEIDLYTSTSCIAANLLDPVFVRSLLYCSVFALYNICI